MLASVHVTLRGVVVTDLILPQLYSPVYLLSVEREGRVEPLVSLSPSVREWRWGLGSGEEESERER